MPVLTVEAMPVMQPVTLECVAEVSRQYQIPVALLGGVLAQERGRLGQSSLNKNGTWDIGPMQVNSAWLKFFAPNGIDQHRLQHDGCANRRRHYNHPLRAGQGQGRPVAGGRPLPFASTRFGGSLPKQGGRQGGRVEQRQTDACQVVGGSQWGWLEEG